MGNGSSIREEHENERARQPRKSVRDLFEKEFGTQAAANQQGTLVEFVANEKNEDTHKIHINPALFKAKRMFMKPLAYKRPKPENLVVKKQNNAALLREMFQRMDPTTTTLSSELIVGQIELAAKYKVLEKSLLIKINRANDLEKDGFGMPNPYVSVALFSAKDPSNTITRQTKFKLKTTSPIFREILMFPLEEKLLADMKLRVSVWDKDVSSQDDFLGETTIKLCQLDLNVGNMLWYKLRPKTDNSITGSIDVTLTIDEPNTLTISVDEGYDLKACHGDTSNPYVRLYVTGIPTKEETKVVEATLNPEWNQSFDFIIHPDEFSRRIVVLNVLSREGHEGRNKRLGDVHISLIDFNISHSGMRRNYTLQDLRNTAHARSKWSEEGLSMEFKEAMLAHTIYGYPKFIFKKIHKGKKIASCRSVQGRSEAKMIIINGISSRDVIQV